jgi:hypothetical protein
MDSGFSLADIGAMLGNRDGNGFGSSGGAIVLIILFALIFLGGGGLFGNRGNNGNAVTEAMLCQSNNFTQLENSVGRLGDQLNQNNNTLMQAASQIGYQNLEQTNGLNRDMCTGFAQAVAATNAVGAQMQQCCCGIEQQIMQNRYDSAMNTAAINANTTEQTQKILDAICSNRMADMSSRIQQLELNQAVAGVVRYPSTFAYNAGTNPFCGGCGCCG